MFNLISPLTIHAAVVGSRQSGFGGDLMMLRSIAAAVIWGGSPPGDVGRVGMVLRRTVSGRGLYLATNARAAAEVAGVPVWLILMTAYVLSSVLTALGAMILTARTGSGEPSIGDTLSLQSAAAAIVGGASRVAAAAGTALLGSVFIIVLSNGMNLVQISGYVQMIVLGVIVVAGVLLDRVRTRRK